MRPKTSLKDPQRRKLSLTLSSHDEGIVLEEFTKLLPPEKESNCNNFQDQKVQQQLLKA